MFESPFCHTVAVKMGTSLKILRLPLREMKISKLSGVCFFCLLCFAQAKKSRSPFGRNQSIMQVTDAVKWGCPLGETQTLHKN